MQVPRLKREGRKDHLVFCDQGNTHLPRSYHELTAVGAAAAAADQFQHLLRRHGFLMRREDGLGLLDQSERSREIQQISAEEGGEHIAPVAAPERRGCPLGVVQQQSFGQRSLGSREQQISQHVGVIDDQGRPSRLAASISAGSKLWGPGSRAEP